MMNTYLEHYILADELGIDGTMLNEHHNAPFCMQARAEIFAWPSLPCEMSGDAGSCCRDPLQTSR
jgi:hypothetical protein